MICPQCQQQYLPHEPVLLASPTFGGKVKRLVDPKHIVMAKAMDKGATFYLSDGSEVFDYHHISPLYEKYPDIFVRVRFGCIVRKSRVEGYRRVRGSEAPQLIVRGLRDSIPVSRRCWAVIAKTFNFPLQSTAKDWDSDFLRVHDR